MSEKLNNNITLKEIVNIHNHLRVPISKIERKKIQGEYPYYGAQGIIDYIDSYIFDGTYLLLAEDGENLRSRKENVAILARGKFWVNNHAHIITTNTKADLYYLYFKINNIDLSPYLTGSVQPKLNRRNLEKIVLNLPLMNEQKKIGKLLYSIEEKININNLIVEELQDIKLQVYKDFFIKEYKHDNKINTNWTNASLENLVNIKYGKNLPKKDLKIEGYKVFGGNGIIGYFDSYMYEEPQILISCRGAASGKLNVSRPKSYITNNSLVLETDNGPLYEYLKNKFRHRDLTKYATGSAQPQITINNIKNVQILLPPENLLFEFYKFAKPIADYKEKLFLENEELYNIKKYLINTLL